MNPRRLLPELFDAALRAVDGRATVSDFLRGRPPQGRVAVFAIGKAAASMAQGAHDVLREAIDQTFIVTKQGHVNAGLSSLPRLTVRESAHPVPDARSLAAGA